jgi:DNA helicase-2/ATP-dependent DNA helicase PcrA
MPLSKNRVIIACAGSGKTTHVIAEALQERRGRVAVITYTNSNIREILARFGEKSSGVPAHVDVMTWFSFLLRQCARPYQRSKYAAKRIKSLFFVNQQSTRGIPETDTARYYFASSDMIYSDKIARFVVECEGKSCQAVTARLGQVYAHVLVDEFQDLSAWDLDVTELLLKSPAQVTLVGDPRQHIYSTSPSAKNKQYLGSNVVDLVRRWSRAGLCSIDGMNETHRCNGEICDFSNALWPGMEPMRPLRVSSTGHDGVFLVAESAVGEYVRCFTPQVLRHNKRAGSYGCEALNFGLAKGLQFDRVLIVPTEKVRRYLRDGNLDHVEKSRDRLHVAVTRAFHSVAFVFDGPSAVVRNRWTPGT